MRDAVGLHAYLHKFRIFRPKWAGFLANSKLGINLELQPDEILTISKKYWDLLDVRNPAVVVVLQLDGQLRPLPLHDQDLLRPRRLVTPLPRPLWTTMCISTISRPRPASWMTNSRLMHRWRRG